MGKDSSKPPSSDPRGTVQVSRSCPHDHGPGCHPPSHPAVAALPTPEDTPNQNPRACSLPPGNAWDRGALLALQSPERQTTNTSMTQSQQKQMQTRPAQRALPLWKLVRPSQQPGPRQAASSTRAGPTPAARTRGVLGPLRLVRVQAPQTDRLCSQETPQTTPHRK